MSRPRAKVDSMHLAELANQGKTIVELAEISGLSVSAVYWRLREARDRALHLSVAAVESREQAASLNARLTANGRCKCGLLLPCHDCVAPAEAYLSSGLTNWGT